MQNLVRATENFSDNCLTAACKAIALLAICIDSAAERLSSIDNLLVSASAKRDHISNLLRERSTPADQIDGLIRELNDNLNSLHFVFSDDQWGNDQALEESTRIWDIILDSFNSLQRNRAS